jgi:hypothetical protein
MSRWTREPWEQSGWNTLTGPTGARELDWRAITAMAGVMGSGAVVYGPKEENGWFDITVEEHLQHALDHIVLWNAGDRREDHLGHAACRLMGALRKSLDDGTTGPMDSPG